MKELKDAYIYGPRNNLWLQLLDKSMTIANFGNPDLSWGGGAFHSVILTTTAQLKLRYFLGSTH